MSLTKPTIWEKLKIALGEILAAIRVTPCKSVVKNK